MTAHKTVNRVLLVSTLIALSACSKAKIEAPPAPRACASVTCSLEGTLCADADQKCHCGDAEGPICSTGEVCVPEKQLCRLAPRCRVDSKWAPGLRAFVEKTTEWGLEALEVRGTRLASADFDHDGYPDLLVRRGGNREDDFSAMGTRRTWLLLNRNGTFEDVTESSMLRQQRSASNESIGRPGEVVAFADVNNDGTLDIYTGMTTGTEDALAGATSELMLNDGQAQFSFADIDSEIRAEFDEDAVAGASFIDFDRDGQIDLWLGQGAYTPKNASNLVLLKDRLLRGDGSGFFFDVTDDVGLETAEWSDATALNEGRAHSRAWSSLACDLNNDGTPELMAASYGRAPNLLWQGKNENGQVRFVNRSVASNYAFDGDQDWKTNEFAKCYCRQNPSADECTGVAAPRINCPTSGWSHSRDRSAYRLGGNSGTSVCADLNNDGFMDILTTEITHWWAGGNADRSEILLNTGETDVRFERIGNDSIGLVRNNPSGAWDNGDMTAAVFDFDNDGWQDIYIGASDYAGNHGLLFQQDQPLVFRELPVEEGIDHNRSHGLTVADFDRDGDLDIVLGHSRSRCDASRPNNCYATRQIRFFENVIGQDGNWIQLELVGGEKTNAAAIGARVTITAASLTQTRQIDGGHGHYGIQHDLTLHFGLGAACEADVVIHWPDRESTVQEFKAYSGYRYRIKQGDAPVVLNVDGLE